MQPLPPRHGGNLAWAAAQAGCSPPEILDFSASINPLGPPDTAIAAIVAHLPDLVAYPDPHYRDLRETLAHHHGVPPAWILPGNGAAELLTWVGRDLAEGGDRPWVLTPNFQDYDRALASYHCSPRPWSLLPLLDQLPRLDSIIPGNTSPGFPAAGPPRAYPLPAPPGEEGGFPRANLLLNNPHNPTGLLLDLQALRPHLAQGYTVVVDEAFMDFLPPPQPQSLIPWLAEFPNLIILRSLTKFYSLPGLRLGYALGHPDRLDRWQQWRDPWSVNSLAVAAAQAALGDRAFQQKTWDWLPAARHHLAQGLAQLPGLRPYPGSANFLLVGCGVSVPPLQQRLLQNHRILIRDCLSFGGLGDRFFRLAVRTPRDHDRLCAAIAQELPFIPESQPS